MALFLHTQKDSFVPLENFYNYLYCYKYFKDYKCCSGAHVPPKLQGAYVMTSLPPLLRLQTEVHLLLVQTGRRETRSQFYPSKIDCSLLECIRSKLFLRVMDKLKKVLSGQDGNDDLNVLQVSYRGELIDTSHFVSLNQSLTSRKSVTF